jgi:hypothetical protein
MPEKTKFRVRFFQSVVDDYGEESETCQRTLPVEAENAASAAEIGVAQFCRTEGLDNWRDHADRFTVEAIDADSSAASTQVRPSKNRKSDWRNRR